MVRSSTTSSVSGSLGCSLLKEEPLSPLELALLKDMSAERRKEGVALAEEIEVKYRREGKFFDEILRGE